MANGPHDSKKNTTAQAAAGAPTENGEFEFDPIDEPTVGHTLLEKLILSIIDGNPGDGKNYPHERQKRMRAAIVAMIGDHPARGSKEIGDHRALHWMAIQVLKNKRSIPSKPSLFFEEDEPVVKFENLTELARAAVNRFGLASHRDAEKMATERLYKKFKGNEKRRKTMIEQRKKSHGLAKQKDLPKTMKEWCDEVIYADPMPHMIEHKMLEEMARNLNRSGVKCTPPDKAKAFF